MRLCVLFAALGALGAALWSGQQTTAAPPPAQQSDEPARISVDVTRVNMLFTVTDKKGRFVTDLAKEDFEVVEGKKPQTIAEFTAESDLPLRLGILIDTSNSVRDRFRFEQDAGAEFLRTVMRARLDKAILVRFDTRAELVTDLLDDPHQLEAGIDRKSVV